MKRFIIGFCLVAIAFPFCLGQITSTRVQPVMLGSPQDRWTELGTIGGTTTTLAVGDRDYTTIAAIVDANSVVWNVPNYSRKAMVSFQTDANADAHVVEVWALADTASISTTGAFVDDDAVYGGTLTLTGGQQTGKHSNVYVDTVTVSDANGVFSYTVGDSGNDRRTVVEFQTKGFKKILWITTTQEASSTLYVEGRSWQ